MEKWALSLTIHADRNESDAFEWKRIATHKERTKLWDVEMYKNLQELSAEVGSTTQQETSRELRYTKHMSQMTLMQCNTVQSELTNGCREVSLPQN